MKTVTFYDSVICPRCALASAATPRQRNRLRASPNAHTAAPSSTTSLTRN
jgi:hypothetical protein